MWNKPGKEQLVKIPRLYETEKIDGKDKIIYLHFFIGGCDLYFAEFDGEDLFFRRQGLQMTDGKKRSKRDSKANQ